MSLSIQVDETTPLPTGDEVIEALVQLLRDETKPRSLAWLCRRYFVLLAERNNFDLRTVRKATHLTDRHKITSVVVRLAEVAEFQEERRVARLVQSALEEAVEKSIIIESDYEGIVSYSLPS